MKPVFTVESLASLCLKSYFIMLFAQLQERSHKKQKNKTKKKNILTIEHLGWPLGL